MPGPGPRNFQNLGPDQDIENFGNLGPDQDQQNFENLGPDWTRNKKNLIIADQVGPVDPWIPDGGIRSLERYLHNIKQHQFETSFKPFISNFLSFVKFIIFSDIN